ncbi:MAG: CsbD family protein [Proteobacteria bacterium]|nr:MAG: CsbD family protein [Pseudomonadota bacterium]
MKGEAQSQWGKLTDDDLDVIAGKQQKLVGRLQERYGYNKDKAEKAVEEWQSKINH